jgi:hypothetical protein
MLMRIPSIRERLQEPSFVARILQIAALMEEELDFALSLYFCGPGRHFEFMDLLLSRMNYESKVQLLERIEVRRTLRSKALALEGIRTVQKVRNLVAHPAGATNDKIAKVLLDVRARSMIEGELETISHTLQSCRRGLYHLSRSKEWRLAGKTAKPTQTDLIAHIWQKRW